MTYVFITPDELYNFNKSVDLTHFLAGLDYVKYTEAPVAINTLDIKQNEKVLDVGSGWYHPIPLLLASKGCIVYATDVQDIVYKHLEYACKTGLGKYINKQLFADVQNATRLTYPDSYFDKICALSSLEHIKGNGDSEAIRELARVLKPGGKAVLSLPFGKTLYETERSVHASYFMRWYDWDAINKRIIKPSGLVVDGIRFLEQTFDFARIWYRLPIYIRFGFIARRFSKKYIQMLDEKTGRECYAGMILITLSKK